MWSDAKGPELQAYIDTGEFPGGKKRPAPIDPEVAAKVAEIRANGGKLIVEAPNGTQ